MRPEFGCIIWDLLFDPLTDDLIQSCVDDCNRIVALDTRVELSDIKVIQYDHGLQIQMDLFYPALNITELFQLDFDRRSVETAEL